MPDVTLLLRLLVTRPIAERRGTGIRDVARPAWATPILAAVNLKHLLIRRFRGIRQLDWTPGGATICLVGPGDSTKTTILKAVEWALSPRWSLPASDTDFFGTATDESIVIEATVGDVPRALLSDQKFGLEQRGWGADGLHDEPLADDDSVITVRLTIDDSLEPRWEVVNDRQTEPRLISARDRESLGATRLGSDVDRHLTWGRGSALLRLTDSTEGMSQTLAAAYRTAREVVNAADLTKLKEAALRASDVAKALGAGASQPYRPALDPSAIAGASALGLHDGPVPARAAGLGSRRLAALAVQRASFAEAGIILVDEIETGLEPHRLRHLLRKLRAGVTGQVLMTTHSDIPLVELRCAELRVVRSEDGIITVQDVPDELQAVVRAAPEALLGRRVIVGEGKTEVGLCRALDRAWAEARGVPPAHVGVVLVPGEGSSAPQTALSLARLGYRSALLIDSDVPLQPPEAELVAGGVAVFAWNGGVCTEERVMLDVPWDVVLAILVRASELIDEDVPQAATDAVAVRLGAPIGTDLEAWLEGGFDEGQIRLAVGLTAKRNGWFKRTDLGEALGGLVAGALPRMEGTDLAAKLNALANWAYAS
jgi:ABC-type branched-subunit amino acid transport system ATPase component